MAKKGNKRGIPSAYDYLRIRRCVCEGPGVGDVCEELHSSLEFLDYFGKDNNDEADDGAHIWIHEGVWDEYMAGWGYLYGMIYGMMWDMWDDVGYMG